jgi:hypothetical protein
VTEKQEGEALSGSERWRPSDDVVAETSGDRLVLIHMQTNKIFELNRTGARVWELLAEGENDDGILRRMYEEFDVDQATLAREVREVLERMTREKLVVRHG